MMTRWFSSIVAWLASILLVGSAWAGDCCQRCGCGEHVRKACRVVCEVKEVKETCYSVVCEDYCLPGRTNCCTRSECGECCEHATPTCGPVRTRQKLVKREITRQVPIMKCVVETICDGCCRNGPPSAPASRSTQRDSTAPAFRAAPAIPAHFQHP